MTNIITACFGGTRYANTRPAWLIDHGMVLKLSGVELPETYFVDFANSKAEQATRVLGNADGVVIPDEYFLSKAQQIYAWVYLTTGDSGFTTLQVTIPLAQRPDVTDEPPTPQETDLIEQAIAALNDGVERAETAADNAEQSAEGVAESEANAAESARLAKLSEDNAKDSEDNAAASERNAALSARAATASEEAAAASERNAESSATAAGNSATAAGNAEEAAQAAQTGAEEAQRKAEDAQEAAEAALAEFTTPTASAVTLAAGSQATASYNNGNFAFGIPKGNKGDTGTTFTPAVSEQGVISWSNDGSKPNPTPVDLAAAVEGVFVVNVSGTTPSIVGAANTRYICGEVSTISIAPPQSGIIDVVFTSGSTAAVLTLPNTVLMPDWFEVEADMVYEINIADGIYGSVMAWAAT